MRVMQKQDKESKMGSSRDIRFRAWDKHKKVFIPPDVWAVCNEPTGREQSVMIKDWEEYIVGEHFYPENEAIMQYTGLKDSKGVEIYEGDVLRCDYPVGHSLYEVKFGIYDNGQDYEDNEHGNGFYHEEWRFRKNGECYDTTPNILTLMSNEYLSRSLYVVGNVYENPELIPNHD